LQPDQAADYECNKQPQTDMNELDTARQGPRELGPGIAFHATYPFGLERSCVLVSYWPPAPVTSVWAAH